MAVEIHPGDDVPRLLGRALRLADAGPRPFYRAALVSLAVTSLGTMAIASFIDPGRTLRGPQRDMIDAALAAFCLSAVLGVLSLLLGGRVRPAWLDRAVDPRARAAIWLALAAWFLFLLIVAYYRAKATFPPSVQALGDRRLPARRIGPHAVPDRRGAGAAGCTRPAAKLASLAGRPGHAPQRGHDGCHHGPGRLG